MGKQTPFYHLHLGSNAKMVDFSGWDMPLHYGSQIEEHHRVRQQAGMFDVSHMGIVDLCGTDVNKFLKYLLANNIDKISPGRALYTCMLNDQGGVIDDLIVYYISPQHYRLVINAGTREKDIAWMRSQLNNYDVILTECNDLAMLAIQGPMVRDLIAQWLPKNQLSQVLALKPFSFIILDDYFIARTGYTGEDGYEIMFPQSQAKTIWEIFLKIGIQPCGLGARDTLRLEAGLNLYGLDMDETVTPLESNLAWTVAFEPNERQFIGRDALLKQKEAGVVLQLTGLVLAGAGIIRHHQKIIMADQEIGYVTSGGYSPSLSLSIGLARITSIVDAPCFVEIRNKRVPVRIIKPPFIRQGKKQFE